MMKRMSGIMVILAAGMMVGGCNLLEFPTYVLFGQSEKKVEAEYEGLRGKHTAIVITTNPGVAFAYPGATYNLALASAYMMKEHVKGVTFVEQEQIDRFQREDLNWSRISMGELGERFGAERIVYMDLVTFTLQEPQSVNLLRGRVIADVRVYEMEAERTEEPAYQTEIAVTYPEANPVPVAGGSTAQIQRQTILRFADTLAKRFYDHKVPVE